MPFQETLANPVHKFRENDAACFLPVKFSIETIPPMNMSIDEMDDYPLVNVNKKLWKITMLLMGKSTISTGPFSIASLQHDTLWLFNIAMDIAHL